MKTIIKKTAAIMLLLMVGICMHAKEAYVVYNSSQKTLTFYYDDQKSQRQGVVFDLEEQNHNDNPDWNYIIAEGFSGVNFTHYYEYKYPYSKVLFDSSFASYRPTTTHKWFYKNELLVEVKDIENLNTSQVTDMSGMFGDCSKLTSLDVSGFDTSKVTDMSDMFFWCESLESLEGISLWDTGKVTNMYEMFDGCSKLTSLDVSHFDTSNVTNMNGMFEGCSKLASLDLSNFDTSNVTDVGEMFRFDSSLTTIYCGDAWSMENVSSAADMFYNCKKLVGGNGTAFDSNQTSIGRAHADGGPSNPGYLTLLPTGCVPTDVAHFPDNQLRTYMRDLFGTFLDSDEMMDTEEIILWERVSDVQNMKGIELFPNLGVLGMKDQDIKTADLSKNKQLNLIYIQGNGMIGSVMDDFVSHLPQGWTNDGRYTPTIMAYDNSGSSTDYNEMTPAQVAAANQKGWTVQVYDENADEWQATQGFYRISEERFPDENFRSALNYADFRCSGIITQEDIDDTEDFEALEDEGISRLTGIEYFDKLQYLLVAWNNLTTADFSKNTRLNTLHIYHNNISGSGMDNLIDHLPNTTNGEILVFYGEWSEEEGKGIFAADHNEMTPEQVAAANANGWKVTMYSDQLEKEIETEGYWLINETRFPDIQLRNVLYNMNLNCSGALTREEAQAVTTLNCANSKIVQLKGVEYFENMETLKFAGNKVQTADLSQNTALRTIECYYNNISGTQMDDFVSHLPTVPVGEWGQLYVIAASNGYYTEQNEMTSAQVAAARAKRWIAYERNAGGQWVEYEAESIATNIGETPSPSRTPASPTFNLQGQRVDSYYRGIVIQNGRKMVKTR